MMMEEEEVGVLALACLFAFLVFLIVILLGLLGAALVSSAGRQVEQELSALLSSI